MRPWTIAVLAASAVTPVFAQNALDSSGNFRERLNGCVGAWNRTPATERGTITYRQFTQKCVSGKTALPAKASALCRNGETQPATEPGGACADIGGVAEWLN